MRRDTFERMAAAEFRMMDSAPKTLGKIKELKHRYWSIYTLREEQFARVTRLALALNVRDGYCQDIKERQQDESKK